MSNETFFAIQLAYRQYPGDSSRNRLHEVLGGDQREQSLPEKRAFWKQVIAIINEHSDHFEYGTWEFIRGNKAEAEFETWSSEIEGGLASEAEELGTSHNESHRLSASIGDTRYVIVTALFLVEGLSNTDVTLGERCDIEKRAYFQRATFMHLLASVPLMNFASVRADAIYVAPGAKRDGITDLELREDWSHLQPVESA